MKKSNTRRGFTLIELLVIVMIIAILAAVAVPQYQKAVLKSRFSTLMPITKSVAQGNEVFYQGRGYYANDMDELDIQAPSADTHATIELASIEQSEDGFDYVLARRSDVPGLAYVVYQDHSGQFPGAIMCEANDTLNPKASELCEKVLQGRIVPDSLQGEGWQAYLLKGEIREGDSFASSGKAGNGEENGTESGNENNNTATLTMEELKAQVCTNESADNCIVSQKNQTVTTRECGNNISYKVGTIQQTGNGCRNTVYNNQGNIIEQSASICGGKGTWDGNNCTPQKSDYSYTSADAYELTYDENGNEVGRKFCTRLGTNNRCNAAYDMSYDENGFRTFIAQRDCSGTTAINPGTLTCPNGYSNWYDYTYNTQGQVTDQLKCSSINQTFNECAQYSSEYSFKVTYGPDGNQNSRTYCTEWQGTDCKGGWEIGYKKVGSNFIICDGTVTAAGVCSTGNWRTNNGNCPNGSVNLETATCNQ